MIDGTTSVNDDALTGWKLAGVMTVVGAIGTTACLALGAVFAQLLSL